MKQTFRIILLIQVLLATSAVPSSSFAQALSGLSLCIDPGHGSGNRNQGPTGLREADINMTISLFLKQFLKSANIDTVLLTRVDDSTNPSLSQREAIANNFGTDWFHSVHHNAFNGRSRFTLVLLEEERTSTNPCPDGRRRGTGQPEWPGQSDVMSQFMANAIFKALRTSSTRVSLDWTFYGGCNGGFSLGVLNNLQMPGELSEGTFHDHAVEERKLRNPDFLKLEARALYMAILDFYDAGKMPTGALSGIVSDAETEAPINGAQITLNPGNAKYTTDNHDNGLFVFHDLEPGTYQLTVSAAEFDTLTKMVQVRAHDFAFADFSLTLAVPPIVTATLPSAQTQNFGVYNQIGFRFNRKMARRSVEVAFRTVPAATGHFIWGANDDIMLFEPDTRFEFSTEYQARLLGSATDASGRPLDGNADGVGGDDFSFSFTTAELDTNRPAVMDFFPVQRDTSVFIRDVFWAEFNKELDLNTISADNIKITRTGGAAVALSLDYVDDGRRRLTFVPQQPLESGQRYFLTFLRGLGLRDGEEMQMNLQRQFTTSRASVQIDFIDDFESAFSWSDPDDSPFTQNTVPENTWFQSAQQKPISGLQSGELSYQFSGPDGRLQVNAITTPDIDLTKVDELGFYLYGDNSGNQIRLILRDLDGVEALPWQVIEWSGWQMLRFDLSQSALQPGENGNGQLDAEQIQLIGIQLTGNRQNSGRLYVEDILTSGRPNTVGVERLKRDFLRPVDFNLAQNYPNPFNPETVINYQVPVSVEANQKVVLRVFNLQGQIVRTLVDFALPPGRHSVVWNGSDDAGEIVSSGVYFYQLTIGQLQARKKMIFIK